MFKLRSWSFDMSSFALIVTKFDKSKKQLDLIKLYFYVYTVLVISLTCMYFVIYPFIF